jgi:hypothetical protein
VRSYPNLLTKTTPIMLNPVKYSPLHDGWSHRTAKVGRPAALDHTDLGAYAPNPIWRRHFSCSPPVSSTQARVPESLSGRGRARRFPSICLLPTWPSSVERPHYEFGLQPGSNGTQLATFWGNRAGVFAKLTDIGMPSLLDVIAPSRVVRQEWPWIRAVGDGPCSLRGSRRTDR